MDIQSSEEAHLIRRSRDGFLMETKMFSWQLESVRLKLQFAGYFGVDKIGIGRRLAFLWKEGFTLSLLSFSSGHIDTNVTFLSGGHFHFMGFYGNPETSLRYHSWELLRRVASPTDDP